MNERRTEMFSLLILVTLTSCVYGLSELEAAEGANTTLQWDSDGSIAPSGLILSCFHIPSTGNSRRVLEVAEGKQLPGPTGGQFSGRVLWDRRVLSLGQVRIVLTRITAQDQGLYWCSMRANYHPPSGTWRQAHTEYFKLTVTRNEETKNAKNAKQLESHRDTEHLDTHTDEPSIDLPKAGPHAPFRDDESELGLFQKGTLYVMFACMMLMALGIVTSWLYHLCKEPT